MTERATIIGYEPSPYYEGWLQCIYRMHAGNVAQGGQVPAEGTIVSMGGLPPRPADAPLPVGTVIEL